MTGVVYTDTRTGEEYEQPAGLVVLSAYVFGNISLLFHSGIGEPYDPVTGKGAVGKNYCYQLSRMGVTMFFENKEFNPFMGAPGAVDGARRCRRRQFRSLGPGLPRRRALRLRARRRPSDRLPAGAARHAALGRRNGRRRRRSGITTPPASRCRARNYANRNNYLDLDPTYKDQLGRPLLRLTYNFVENDYKVMEYTRRRRGTRSRRR